MPLEADAIHEISPDLRARRPWLLNEMTGSILFLEHPSDPGLYTSSDYGKFECILSRCFPALVSFFSTRA